MHIRFFASAFLAASLAQAASITVVNGGFEDTSVGTTFNEFTFGPPAGWSLYDPNNITSDGDGPSFFVGTIAPPVVSGQTQYFPDGAPEGSRVGIAFNFLSSRVAGEYGLVQTLSATLQADTAYSLRVRVGNIASGTSVDNTVYNLDGFPGYRIDLLAGGVVIASDNNSLLPAEGTFLESTINLTTGASHAQLGQALGIRLVNLNVIDGAAPTADLEVDFDHVRLDAVAIPEPASAGVLLGLLAGGLAAAGRRRRG